MGNRPFARHFDQSRNHRLVFGYFQSSARRGPPRVLALSRVPASSARGTRSASEVPIRPCPRSTRETHGTDIDEASTHSLETTRRGFIRIKFYPCRSVSRIVDYQFDNDDRSFPADDGHRFFLAFLFEASRDCPLVNRDDLVIESRSCCRFFTRDDVTRAMWGCLFRGGARPASPINALGE